MRLVSLKRDALQRHVLFRVLMSLGALCHLSSAAAAMAASGDEHWDRQFGWPGTTNFCLALRDHDNRLYAGGFNPTQGATNSSLDVWDGTRWSSLGVVYGRPTAVYDFAFLGSDIYVGGIFSGVNDVAVSGLARWNGTTWSDVGGFRGAVFALATDGVNLYVGGTFTNVGGTILTNIARWDGATWSAMGAGLGPYTGGLGGVAALLWTGTELYAGGSFTNSGAVSVPALGRWDGSGWTAVGGGVRAGGGEDGRVQALAWNGSELFVGGYFVQAGGIVAVNVARWNGAAWSDLLGNLNDQVFALAVSGTNLYIGGAFTNVAGIYSPGIVRWSASRWYQAGIMDGEVNELLSVGTNLYVGGGFVQADDRILNHIGLRDGNRWAPIGSGNGLSFFAREVTASTNGIFAGGFFTGAGEVAASRVARWNGNNWSPLGGGVKGVDAGNGTLVTAIAAHKTDVFVGGTFTNAGGVSASNIARWNGQSQSWQALGSGINGSVLALETLGSTVYAGGFFTVAGGNPASRLAAWDGVNWSAVGGGVNSNVNALAVADDGLYVGGRFTQAGGFVTANRIVRWDGASWNSLGTGAENGVNGSVNAIAVHGAEVFVGGSFTTAGTVTANRVARWDGSQWSALGAGVSGGSGTIAVNTMVYSGGYLYVGGNFTNAGGSLARPIARWDGTNWSALGSGLTMSPGSPSVSGLAALDNDLFVAGIFIGAGGKDSRYFARWNDLSDFDAGATLRLSAPVALGNGSFQFRVTASGVANYVVEATTNFASWSPLLTNSAALFDFVDPGAAGRNRRFYRSRGL